MKNIFPVLCILFAGSASAQIPAQIADTLPLRGLPILRSYVAPEVVHRAAKKFGRSLYCIEKSTAANCQDSYLVGLLRSGSSLRMEWMCDDPKMVWLESKAGAVALNRR